MAVTLGNLIERILYETNKSADDFEVGVKNAIVTAIIYMESAAAWALSKSGDIVIPDGSRSTNLPVDLNVLVNAVYNIGTTMVGSRQGFIQMSFDDLINLFGNTGEVGYPARYGVFGEQFYVYPFVNTDTTITLHYYYKDAQYPDVDSDTSVWFAPELVDIVRNKALEIFYRDTLQSPDIASTYVPVVYDYIVDLRKRNNYRNTVNLLSV